MRKKLQMVCILQRNFFCICKSNPYIGVLNVCLKLKGHWCVCVCVCVCVRVYN